MILSSRPSQDTTGTFMPQRRHGGLVRRGMRLDPGLLCLKYVFAQIRASLQPSSFSQFV